jgi:putative transposase
VAVRGRIESFKKEDIKWNGGSTALEGGDKEAVVMGASAPGKRVAPQEVRTFFISATAWGRRSVFQTERMAGLLLDVLRDYREKRRFQLHEFVLMPNHFHLLLTPAAGISLEKCVQYIKGGFSFRAKKELGYAGEIWQAGYNEHRVKDASDYQQHVRYIYENPVRARMCGSPKEYEYSSASGKYEVDPAPEHFRG